MSKQTEALKLALEALKMCRGVIRNNIENLVPIESPNPWFSQDVDHAITAIREALAEQPTQQQEPVAITNAMAFAFHRAINDGDLPASDLEQIKHGLSAAFANTSPQPAQPSKPWVGLTDEDIQEVRENCGITHHAIKTIEAKLREKNA